MATRLIKDGHQRGHADHRRHRRSPSNRQGGAGHAHSLNESKSVATAGGHFGEEVHFNYGPQVSVSLRVCSSANVALW